MTYVLCLTLLNDETMTLYREREWKELMGLKRAHAAHESECVGKVVVHADIEIMI